MLENLCKLVRSWGLLCNSNAKKNRLKMTRDWWQLYPDGSSGYPAGLLPPRFRKYALISGFKVVARVMIRENRPEATVLLVVPPEFAAAHPADFVGVGDRSPQYQDFESEAAALKFLENLKL